MSDWHKVSLGEFVSLRRGHDLPARERTQGCVPVVGSGGIVGYHDTAIAPGPGVTVGRAANLGSPSFVDCDYWPLNTTLYVDDFCGNDPRFVYYLFLTLDLTGFDSGSVQPMLNRNYIRRVPIRVPSPSGQREVATVLGVLDDKIAVNERVAATSRQLGEARFADVVQGSGGRKIRLGDLVETLTRGVAPRYTEDDDALVVLNQKCIRAGRVGLDPARRTESGNVQSGKYLKMNDVLVNSTGAGTLGRVARWAGDIPATVDSHVTIVRFSSDRMNPMCGAFAILAAQPEIESMGEGSTGQTELGRAKLSDLVLAVPAPEKCESIGAGLEVLEARGEAALRESITLAELRDALLPKLMSGEIRVRDAEKVVEDVT